MWQESLHWIFDLKAERLPFCQYIGKPTPYLLFVNPITSLPLLRHESFIWVILLIESTCMVLIKLCFLQLFSCYFETVAYLPGQPYLRCGKRAGVPNLTKKTGWPVWYELLALWLQFSPEASSRRFTLHLSVKTETLLLYLVIIT